MIRELVIQTPGRGLCEFTHQVVQVVLDSGVDEGLCTLFVRHTSCSLCIQENADPSAKVDLERWLCRLAPEGDPQYTHVSEGADDMPSHLKAAVTATSVAVPIYGGKLLLGTWQGIYLWEHRRAAHERRVVVHIGEG